MASAPAAAPVTCRSVAAELGEPLLATAGTASAWLVVEHTGAWARKPFSQGFDPEVAAALDRLSAAAPVKVVAVRRPGTSPPDPGSPRLVALAYCGPGSPWLATTSIGTDRDLLGLGLWEDPEATAGGTPPPDLAPDPDPLYLVCTHARRDACCGSLGRPVARALAGARPGRVWESSHLGGHRFAANLLCLPTGVLYGRVLEAAEGLELVGSLERGEVDPGHLRGVSWQLPAAQAATALLRERTGLRGLMEVEPRSTEQVDDGSWRVLVDTSLGAWEVEVRWSPTGVDRPVSCGSDESEDPGRWDLEALARR